MSDHPSTATAAPAPATPPAEQVIPVRIWRDGNACEFLTVAQHAALTALTEGKTIRESAEAAGVHRNTVSQWLHRDPVFQAAYNGWRQEMLDSTRAKVLGLAEAAAATVARAVAKGDARIALSVLKDMGLTRPDAEIGSTHPGVVRLQMNKEDEKRDDHIWKLEHRELFAYPSVRQDLQRRLAEPSSPEAESK